MAKISYSSLKDNTLVFLSFCLFLWPSFSYSQNHRCAAEDLSLQTVHIIGEDHYNPDSRQFRDQILQGAARGEYLLASEITEYAEPFYPELNDEVSVRLSGSNEQSLLYGIESLIGWSLVSSYENQRWSTLITPNERVLTLINDSRYSSILRHIFYTIPNNPSVQNSEDLIALARRLAQTIESLSNANYETSINQGNLFNKIESQSVWDYLSIFYTASLDLAQNQHNYDLGVIPENPYEFIQYYQDYQMQRGQHHFLYTLRDRDFSQNIFNILCSSIDQETLYVLVGAGHVTGVRNHLTPLLLPSVQIYEHSSFNTNYEDLNCSLFNNCN